MGTSNLYGGPKKTNLLPPDYDLDNSLGHNESDDNKESQDPSSEQDAPAYYQPIDDNPILTPTVSWGTVRRSMSDAAKNRNSSRVRGVISNYTKALGGPTNAAAQAVKARNVAAVIYSLFSGSPEAIRKNLELSGASFDERTTREIFHDICQIIAPIPNDLEDSLVNIALLETFADVAADPTVDLNNLETFNVELLQRLVGGIIKHYIFKKLLMQSEQSALKNCQRVSHLRELEQSIKLFIDGIVDGIVPKLVRKGLNPLDVNRAIDTLFDVTYQQMEEL